MTVDFEIIVGTYEQFLLGYKVTNVDSTYTLERSFATRSHLASVRAVASSRHYLASAGADDCVCLYDMRYRIESGRLAHHNGTVNCVAFSPDSSHVMTTSADGSIGIVRCGNWELEKHWRSAHKGSPVNALAIHPTGKLAMSVGGDGVLRTWNLVKGRQAYATNLVPRLKHEARDVALLRWSPQGDRYVLATNRRLDIYALDTAAVCAELHFESRLVSLEFVRNDVLAIGREDGRISFCNVAAGTRILEDVVAHDARVKCLAYRDNYLVSGSSSGVIKLWRYGKKALRILSETSCGARITCIALAQLCANPVAMKEQPEAAERIAEPRKTAFRVRREVVVEDEDVGRRAKKRKKSKSVGKREAEVATFEGVRLETKSTKKTRTDEIPDTKNIDGEPTRKKKRNSSVDKSDESPAKKTKRASAKKVSKGTAVSESENADSKNAASSGDVATMKSKRKKKKRHETTSNERIPEPDAKKRKIRNGIPSACSPSSKAKKKKATR